jgi:hypothetical protein
VAGVHSPWSFLDNQCPCLSRQKKKEDSMKLKQIVVSIENAPGRLFEVTHALGKAGINLRALNLVDTGAFGQLRLLVSNVAKARRILMKLNIPAFVNEVVAAEIEDKPGSLAKILRPLNAANLYVVFMYAFIRFSQGKAVMIFRFSDNDKAIEVLQDSGINLLDAEAFGILETES